MYVRDIFEISINNYIPLLGASDLQILYMTGYRPLLLHPVTIYQEVPGTALFSALNLRWLCPFSFKVSALTELKRGCQIP